MAIQRASSIFPTVDDLKEGLCILPNRYLDDLIANELSGTTAQADLSSFSEFTPSLYERLTWLSLAQPKTIRQLHYIKFKEAIYEDVLFGKLQGIKSVLSKSLNVLQVRLLISAIDEVVSKNIMAVQATFRVLESTMLRYRQLGVVEFQKSPMKEIERIRTAFYIENTLIKIQNVQKCVLKTQETHLTHTLQVDFTKKVCYVISQGDASLFYDEGSVKEITATLELKISNRRARPEVVVHATPKKNSDPDDVQLALKEIAFYSHFKGNRGIIQLQSYCNYTEIIPNRGTAPGNSEVRPSLIFKKYDRSLLAVIKQDKLFNLEQQLAMSEDLIYGLANIHGQGIIHGDLKLENTLYRVDNFGRAVAVIIDFGLAFDLLKQEPATFVYRWGYYGSFLNTAPELFGKPNFQGSFFKTEVWALGVMLHELHFGKTPEWAKIIHRMYKTNFKSGAHVDLVLLDKVQGYVLDQIHREVLPKLARFEEIERTRALPKNERFCKLIYRMLHPEPDKRMTLEEAKLEIAQIKSGYTETI